MELPGESAGHELYIQDGVLLKGETASLISYMGLVGTLSIVEYAGGGKYIEWKPSELVIDSDCPDAPDQEQDWAMVDRVRYHRPRTTSESSTAASDRPRHLKVKINDIKSFRVARRNQQVFFNDQDGVCVCSFLFQNGSADNLVRAMRTFTRMAPGRKDKNLYIVHDDMPEAQILNRSFAELNIFPEQTSYYPWSFFKNFHNRPLETTLEAFSKLTDIVYRTPAISQEESDLLNRSLSQLDDITTTHTQDEYEVVAHQPELPVQIQVRRGNPLSEEQWLSLRDAEGRIQDVECLKQVIFRGGISPSLRNEVWKYLLDLYPWESTAEERGRIFEQKCKEYHTMKSQWTTMTPKQEENFSYFRDRKSLIEKDVNRTDRTIPFFAGDNNPNLQLLADILMTYVMYNFDLGYVQGMSDLLSPILCVVPNEVEAFWCFACFMERMKHSFDMEGMKDQLLQLHRLLGFVDLKFANYLQQHDCGNMFFCFRWLLVWFKRELSQQDIFRLWEVLWTEVPCQNFHLLLSVAILLSQKEVIVRNDYGFTEILKHINDLCENIDLQAMLSKAESIYHQIHEASHLTDSIRGIVGMPQVGAPEHESSQDRSSSPEHIAGVSPDSTNSTEETFEKSIGA